MKRSLRTLGRVSRTLVTVMTLSVVFVLCPCVPGAEGAMDDCCEHLELSISSLCCDSAPTVSPAPVSPAVVSLAPPLVVRAVPVDFRTTVGSAERAFIRSVAAHTILRI